MTTEETRMDDDIETITDRAAIRDSDEPDLRSRGSLIVAASALRGASSLTDDDDTAQWLETLAQQFDDEAADARPTPDLRASTGAATIAAELADTRQLLRLRSDALARVSREAEALRVALSDFAIHGTRHDLNPTHRSGDEAFWHRYIGRMDESVQDRARAALATTGEGE